MNQFRPHTTDIWHNYRYRFSSYLALMLRSPGIAPGPPGCGMPLPSPQAGNRPGHGAPQHTGTTVSRIFGYSVSVPSYTPYQNSHKLGFVAVLRSRKYLIFTISKYALNKRGRIRIRKYLKFAATYASGINNSGFITLNYTAVA